jgi:hypothetical protein
MKLSRSEWTCLDPEVGVWARTYAFTSGGYANCLVFRLSEGKLAVISPATEMSEADFDALDALGEVAALLAPNGLHHLGLPGFIQRYPAAKVYAHEVTAKRVLDKNPAVPHIEPMSSLEALLPPHVRVFHPGNMKMPDMMATIETPEGTIWYSNDVLGNLPKLPKGPFGWLYKWTRSGPGFRVNRWVLWFLRPEKSFGAWLMAEFEKHPPRMVVPGHGHVVAEGDVVAQARECLRDGF